jgi:hypothetical protein
MRSDAIAGTARECSSGRLGLAGITFQCVQFCTVRFPKIMLTRTRRTDATFTFDITRRSAHAAPSVSCRIKRPGRRIVKGLYRRSVLFGWTLVVRRPATADHGSSLPRTKLLRGRPLVALDVPLNRVRVEVEVSPALQSIARSGGDLLVEAEVLFNGGDADCELEALVEIGRHVILDDGQIARVVIENLRVIGERG